MVDIKKNTISTANNSVIIVGNIKHCAIEQRDIYIFGTIQHNWFYNDEMLQAVFTENKLDETFFSRLNGNFSLVIVEKNSNKMTLVANRSGGFRLYVKSTNGQLFIADKLSHIVDKKNTNHENKFCQQTLHEVIDFRWNSGNKSLIEGIEQQPSATIWHYEQGQRVKETCYQDTYISAAKHTATLKESADEVAQLLSTAIEEAKAPNARVAVLLSGGVDSSILAALASKHQDNLTAISHRADDYHNPELETAIEFAKTLGIKHEIYTINHDEIVDAFISTIDVIEQPIRYQSTLILYKLFEKMAGKYDQIIGGYAADTLFGTNVVKRYKLRKHKRDRIKKLIKNIPMASSIINALPKTTKLYQLMNETPEAYMWSIAAIEYTQQSKDFFNKFKQTFPLLAIDRAYNINEPVNISTEELEIARIKTFLFRSDMDNYLHETLSIANYFNMELINPFYDYRLIAYAAKLQSQHYFGEEFVKPILRKIGTRYFPPHLMYTKKIGFPTPYQQWLEQPLNALWLAAQQKLNIPEHLSNDSELQWTATCLEQFAKSFTLPPAFKSQ